MNHKKFLSIATSLGLGVSLLAGCTPNTPTPTMKDKEKKDEQLDSSRSSHSSTVAPIVGGTSKSSKGIGTARGGNSAGS